MGLNYISPPPAWEAYLGNVGLDLDSSVNETAGEQAGTVYNGHFDCTCCHPPFGSNRFGDAERALLREGNVHRAKRWRAVLGPVVARYRIVALQSWRSWRDSPSVWPDR